MDKCRLLIKELEWLKRKVEDANSGIEGEIEDIIREVISSSGEEESIDELLVRILMLIGG